MNLKRNISYVAVFLLIFQLVNNTVFAQDAVKKIKPKIRLSYTKVMGEGSKLTATAYYKLKKVKTLCSDCIIGFYTGEDEEGLFEKIPTDKSGVAVLSLNTEQLAAFKDTSGKFLFFVQVEPSDKYKRKATDLEIMDANLAVNFVEGDSVNNIEALLTVVTDSTDMPINRKPIKFLVKRALSMLNIGGDKTNYTDSKGAVIVEFPDDLPGTAEGIVSIVVKLDEDDDYGTIEFKGDANWGALNTEHKEHSKRSLYGNRDNAPLFMVVLVNAVLITIWGYLFYIVFGLIKIKRLSKQEV